MRAGALRHQLEIYWQGPATPNTFGESEAAWSLLETLWVEFTYSRGNENFEAEQTKSLLRATARTRYTDTVKASMRAKYDGTWFLIVGANPIKNNRKEIEIELIEYSDGP